MDIHSLNWHDHTHIGLDLDETLACTFEGFLAYAQDRGKLLHLKGIEDIKSHDAAGLSTQMSGEEISAIWEGYGQHTLAPESVPPVPDALIGVRRLYDLGKEIAIVTARSDKESWKVERTTRWVRSHFSYLDDSNIHFVNHFSSDALPKSTICKKFGISLMIDDAMENAHELTKNGIACVLLEKPWNRHGDFDHPLLYRTKGWGEIITSLS